MQQTGTGFVRRRSVLYNKSYNKEKVVYCKLTEVYESQQQQQQQGGGSGGEK